MKRARDTSVVRAAMQERGLSHREVARLAGCSKSTIAFVADGERCVNDQLAQALARVLRRPVDHLFVPAPSTDERPSGHNEAVA